MTIDHRTPHPMVDGSQVQVRDRHLAMNRGSRGSALLTRSGTPEGPYHSGTISSRSTIMSRWGGVTGNAMHIPIGQ